MKNILSSIRAKKDKLTAKLKDAVRSNRTYKVIVYNDTDEHSPIVTWCGQVINDKGEMVASVTKLSYNEAKASAEKLKEHIIKGGE